MNRKPQRPMTPGEIALTGAVLMALVLAGTLALNALARWIWNAATPAALWGSLILAVIVTGIYLLDSDHTVDADDSDEAEA